jgi:serine-type D-Ala-D-Ala carboxypeptidase
VTLDELLAEGVAPMTRAAVMHRGQLVFHGGTAPAQARFDLASVSKVMSTTALLCEALRAGVLRRDTRVGDVFPHAAAAHVTVDDLAHHRAGLMPYTTWFADVLHLHPKLATPAAHYSLREHVRAELIERHLKLAPERAAGQAAVYSDVSFILLGAMLEAVLQLPLDIAFETHVARRFSLTAGYRRLSLSLPDTDVVPTQRVRPRPPAPGQEGRWELYSPMPSQPGEVDDDTCFVMNGVAGHAGLFGTAVDVARFGQAVLEGQVALPSRAIDSTVPGSTRTFGFDTPGTQAPSCGPLFSLSSLGHTGFTGTSLWVDFERHLVVSLLTNRTALGRDNLAIRTFRPRFHTLVAKSFQ